MNGRCHCGAIRFEVTGPIQAVGNCHCTICRRVHGTPYSTFAQVARGDLKLTSGADAIRRYRSSEPVERSFCGTCGSHFTFAFDGMPAVLWVAAGALDDHPSLRPAHHMFVRSKASWHEITDDLPQHAEYPPFTE
jgi:hypothetical protein